jgi:hypothetical protein
VPPKVEPRELKKPLGREALARALSNSDGMPKVRPGRLVSTPKMPGERGGSLKHESPGKPPRRTFLQVRVQHILKIFRDNSYAKPKLFSPRCVLNNFATLIFSENAILGFRGAS